MLKMSTYLKAICFASVKRWALSNICFLCPPGAETWTPRWYHRQTDRRISKISKTFHVHFFPLSPKFEWNVKNTMTVCLKLSPGRSEGKLFQKPIFVSHWFIYLSIPFHSKNIYISFVYIGLSSIYLFVLLVGLPAQWYHRQTDQEDQQDFQDSPNLATS